MEQGFGIASALELRVKSCAGGKVAYGAGNGDQAADYGHTTSPTRSVWMTDISEVRLIQDYL